MDGRLLRYVPLSLLRLLARTVAWGINQRPNRGMLRKVRINLQLAYPHLSGSELSCLAQDSVERQCLSYVEALKSWVMPPDWSVAQIAHVHGLASFEQAIAQAQGCLIIVPHLGTWEMMNAWVSQRTSPIIMYKPVKDARLNQLMLQARQRLNAKLVPTDAQGVKVLYKNLKQGGSSVILPDHVPPHSGGVIVPFFGVPCLTATLVAKMTHKTQCALIGLSCLRRLDGRFEIYCDALTDPDLYHADLLVATSALNRALETIINRSCADYTWSYKRFKGVASVEKSYSSSSV